MSLTDEVEADDVFWFSTQMKLLADQRRADTKTMIDQINAAVTAYFWRALYHLCTRFNCHTVMA